LDKPIFVGFTVLERAKLHMYNLHYRLFKPYYEDKIELLYTDTDSFVYSITTQNVYHDFGRNYFYEHLDMSDYPKDNPLFSDKNKKVLGKMKDEMNGKVLEEFIALKSKLYAFLCDEKEKKTAKGLHKNVVQKFVNMDHYRNVLKSCNMYAFKVRSIQSKSHIIKSVESIKCVHNCFDDKRWIHDDGVHTLAYGHKNIKDCNNE
jgi:hypothetical protein